MPRCPDLRVSPHHDPGPGTVDPGEPRVGGGLEVALVVVLLRVLAHQPHVAVVVLRPEGELALQLLAVVDVAVPQDDRPHAVDLLREIRDREDDPMGQASSTAVGAALVGELHPRLERQEPVVDLGRVGEVGGVEVRVDRRPCLGLVDAYDLLAAAGAERRRQRDRGQCAPPVAISLRSHCDPLTGSAWRAARAPAAAGSACGTAASYCGRTSSSTGSISCFSQSRSALAIRHLLTLQLGERGAVEARARGRSGRAGCHARPDDRLEALLEVAVDLVGLLVAVALVQHARRPLLGRLHHALVLDDALVELVELLDQGREHRRASECGLAGVLRAAAELGEVARVDRLRERDPGLSPPSARS